MLQNIKPSRVSVGKMNMKPFEKIVDRTFNMKNFPSLLNVPSEVYCNVLKVKIQSMPKTGFIIESLESIFLKTPLGALNGLYYGFGNAKYIHLIILYYSYEHFHRFAYNGEEELKRTKLLGKIYVL